MNKRNVMSVLGLMIGFLIYTIISYFVKAA